MVDVVICQNKRLFFNSWAPASFRCRLVSKFKMVVVCLPKTIGLFMSKNVFSFFCGMCYLVTQSLLNRSHNKTSQEALSLLSFLT